MRFSRLSPGNPEKLLVRLPSVPTHMDRVDSEEAVGTDKIVERWCDPHRCRGSHRTANVVSSGRSTHERLAQFPLMHLCQERVEMLLRSQECSSEFLDLLGGEASLDGSEEFPLSSHDEAPVRCYPIKNYYPVFLAPSSLFVRFHALPPTAREIRRKNQIHRFGDVQP